jgi:hypothetical protein
MPGPDEIQITSDYNNLYNGLYCPYLINDVVKNGYYSCNNCAFNSNVAMTASTDEHNLISNPIKTDSINSCQNLCNARPYCTTYEYNSGNGNCTIKTGFPSDIIKDQSNIYSGYKVNVPPPAFSTLTSDKQVNIRKRCLNQYINNSTTINNKKLDPKFDLKDKMTSSDNYKSGATFDPRDMYNTLLSQSSNMYGLQPVRSPNDNFQENPDINMEPIKNIVIDTRNTNYNNYINNKATLQRINNDPSNDDMNNAFSSVNNSIISDNTTLTENLKKYINSSTDNQINEVNNYINTSLEGFENNNSNNNNIIFLILIAFVLIFLFYILRKK